MTRIHHFLRKSRGAAAIEFALTMPVLFLLLSAVVDWGYYMSTRVTIARTAMDGARAGAASRNDPSTGPDEIVVNAQARAAAVLLGMGKTCGGGCAITATHCAVNQGTPAACQTPPLQTIVVTVQYPYTPFFGWVATPVNLKESFMMVVEGQ